LKAKDRDKIVDQFMNYLLTFIIKPENLKTAVENNLDLTTLLFNHYHLHSNIIFPLFKFVARAYWDKIEEYLCDVPKIYRILSQNPDNIQILERTETKKYLNEQITKLYQTLYILVWWT